MKFLIAKMTDFTPKTWPVVSPPYNKPHTEQSKKACIDLIKELNNYDGIIIVGSINKHTPNNKKGKILGIAFCGNTIHQTKDVVDKKHLCEPGVWKDGIGNNFRWPYGVAITEAFVFKPPYMDARKVCDPKKIGCPDIFSGWYQSPLLKKLSSKQSKSLMKEFQNIPSRLKTLPKLDAQVETDVVDRQRTIGPPPSSNERKKSSQFIKEVFKKSNTYAFRFNKCDCWKIGLTSRKVDIRLAEINKHIPRRITNGKEWKKYKIKCWGDGNLAYLMEQKILDILEEKHAVDGEMVYCDEKALKSAWNEATKDKR